MPSLTHNTHVVSIQLDALGELGELGVHDNVPMILTLQHSDMIFFLDPAQVLKKVLVLVWYGPIRLTLAS